MELWSAKDSRLGRPTTLIFGLLPAEVDLGKCDEILVAAARR